MDWIDAGVAWISDMLNNNLPDGPVKAMLVDGAIAGVGAVIVFLPQILILYFFISYMETVAIWHGLHSLWTALCTKWGYTASRSYRL